MVLNGFLGAREGARFSSFHEVRRYLMLEGGAHKGQAVGAGAVVRAAFARGNGAFLEQKVVAIQGQADRGLTWAAQEMLAEIGKADPPWKKTVALGPGNALAEMLRIAGWREPRRALRSSGVALPPAGVLGGLALILPAASAGTLCAAAYGAFAAGAFRAAGPLALLAASALGLAAWWVVLRMARAKTVGRLVEILEDPGLAGSAAAAAGAALGRRLPGVQAFLVFVVDHYSRLSAAARAAIMEALRQNLMDHIVTWIIFDSQEPGMLRTDLAGLKGSGGGGPPAMMCDMLAFSPEQRARIAEANNLGPDCARSDDELFAALRTGNRSAADPVPTPPTRGPKAAA